MKAASRDAAAFRESAERLAGLSKRATRAASATALGASRSAMAAAPAVVVKAATILEEEIAITLGAVKRIEQRFIDVDAMRKHAPDAVMAKFRRDAHDAVDIILDVLTAAAQTVGAQAGKFVNVTAGASAPSAGQYDGAPAGLQVPALRIPGTVTAGRAGVVAMALENPSDVGTASFTLHASDLVSASGTRIESQHVVFTPASLSVGPRQAGRVEVSVAVPPGTPAGTYEGLVRATQMENLRAMLAVVVA